MCCIYANRKCFWKLQNVSWPFSKVFVNLSKFEYSNSIWNFLWEKFLSIKCEKKITWRSYSAKTVSEVLRLAVLVVVRETRMKALLNLFCVVLAKDRGLRTSGKRSVLYKIILSWISVRSRQESFNETCIDASIGLECLSECDDLVLGCLNLCTADECRIEVRLFSS